MSLFIYLFIFIYREDTTRIISLKT